MSDLIRREDVLQAINNHFWGDMEWFFNEIEEEIKDIPTIATDEVIAYKCPECHKVNIIWTDTDEFCPNCGIKRRY